MTPAVSALCNKERKKKRLAVCWVWCRIVFLELSNNKVAGRHFFHLCYCCIRVCRAPTSPSRCCAVWWPTPRWGNPTPVMPLWPDSWWTPSPSSAWMPVSVTTSKTWLTPPGMGQLQAEVCVRVFWEVEVLCVHSSVREGDCGYLTIFYFKMFLK